MADYITLEYSVHGADDWQTIALGPESNPYDDWDNSALAFGDYDIRVTDTETSQTDTITVTLFSNIVINSPMQHADVEYTPDIYCTDNPMGG